jgi:hypothetical protein
MNTTVSYGKYIQIGSLMLVLCILLLVIYTQYFQDVSLYSNSYSKTTCVIVSMEISYTKYTCFGIGGFVTVTNNMPCVYVQVNTSSLSYVKFYRNFQEKSILESLNLNVCRMYQALLNFFGKSNYLSLCI